jgi:ribonuclease P protein component
MSSPRKLPLGYHQKLHTQADFNRVFRRGIRLENSTIKIIAFLDRQSPQRPPRLALITSRKVGGAVERNRTKRRIREIFRVNQHSIYCGWDILFILKKKSVKADFNLLQKSIFELFKKGRIFAQSDIRKT